MTMQSEYRRMCPTLSTVYCLFIGSPLAVVNLTASLVGILLSAVPNDWIPVFLFNSVVQYEAKIEWKSTMMYFVWGKKKTFKWLISKYNKMKTVTNRTHLLLIMTSGGQSTHNLSESKDTTG